MLLPGALKPQMLINGHIKEGIEAHAPTLTTWVIILPQSPLLELEKRGGERSDFFPLKRGVFGGKQLGLYSWALIYYIGYPFYHHLKVDSF